MSFFQTILIIPVLACTLGCAGADKAAEELDVAAAAEAAQEAAAAATPGADLAGFPMPDAPAGEEHVVGTVRHTAKGVDQGADCSAGFEARDGGLTVSVSGLSVNCCTERFRAAVDAAGGTLTLRLYEYLPDVCECTHLRNVELDLQGLGEVTRLVVFLNGGLEPVAAAAI